MKILHFALALLATVPAQALAQQSAVDLRSPAIQVTYADLDLRSAAGIQTLERRLAGAIKKSCFETTAKVDLRRTIDARRCIASKTSELAAERDRILANNRSELFAEVAR